MGSIIAKGVSSDIDFSRLDSAADFRLDDMRVRAAVAVLGEGSG